MSEVEREIAATREFNAPRELVFKVWTQPQHIAQWWGPTGFTTTTHEMDVRAGGVWRFVMHGPDGTDYDNEISYVEVVPPERLVYDHGPSPRFRVTVIFTEKAGKTLLSLRMLFKTAAERDKVAKEFKAIEGLNQTLDRLGEHLTSISP
jgi:uncharacterized protein YndB with AHSA1/START domain